ncbi:MAG TPA: hypothetical protein VM580_31390, partial [Labilithrix sp.]|nr:hypothetical protein [Labilithrix sp.]
MIDAREPDETALANRMIDVLRRKMERDYAKGQTKRDAHPKALGVLKGVFQIEGNVPDDLAVGLFANAGNSYDCWLRFSNANGGIQPDNKPDQRGLAIKLLTPGTDKPLGQDFVLLSHPTIPFGTIRLFRDVVYHAIETSPV